MVQSILKSLAISVCQLVFNSGDSTHHGASRQPLDRGASVNQAATADDIRSLHMGYLEGDITVVDMLLD